jgi:DNA polymerase-3 subunit epsilon
MKLKHTFDWLIIGYAVLTALLILAAVFLVWYPLSSPEKDLIKNIFTGNAAYVLGAGFVVLVGFGLIIEEMFRGYIFPIRKLAEEVELIYSVNAAHRISLDGSPDFKRLVAHINAGTDQFEALQMNVSRKIDAAMVDLAKEKNILAAMMAELPEAILICNGVGQIILYNTQAKRFFNEHVVRHTSGSGDASNGETFHDYEKKRFLGIGRSIFELVDRNVIQHALDELHVHLDRKEEDVVSSFVLTAKGNRLLRGRAVPVLNSSRAFSGFIIIFSDITQGLRSEARAEFLVHSFQNRIRHSATSIKSAIGIMREYPDMGPERRRRLIEIIQNESSSLGQLIKREATAALEQPKKEWPLVPVRAVDLIDAFKKKAANLLGVTLDVERANEDGWVRADTYSMLLILLFMLERVVNEVGVNRFRCTFRTTNQFVHFDLAWKGAAIKLAQLREWENLELQVGREGLPLYFKEVLDYHSAEVWPQHEPEMEGRAGLRLYLPLFKSPSSETSRQAAVLLDSRPEFYNFDLFNQAGQTPDLDDCLLADLTFSVFDTETTGLDPGGGDRIISIGAVRIVKMHMLSEERFDHLINPGRDIPEETTRIHGIDAGMVRSKPGIGRVLPMFHQFVADTIMVAHNAAFDMRMLQTCEGLTGIKFLNPVLDTLLLLAVLHPAHERHNIKEIARRLGVDIVGRHTAIGDATTTAMLLLKMIPLLGNMGIYTLKEAREASQKTYYARLKF